MALAGVELATVGDNCIDRYLPPVGLTTVGGNAVNVAVQLRRRGRLVAYLGAVGGDAAGWRVLGALAEQDVLVTRVRFAGAVTARTDLRLEAGGERSIVYEDFGACADYVPDDAAVAFLSRLRHVHIGWLKGANDVRRRLSANGVSVSQDCAVTPGFDGLRIAFCSAADPFGDAPELAAAAIDGGAALAVVTCGAQGSLAYDGRSIARAGAAPTHVADTTGAGDAFIAAFIDAHLAGHEVPTCLEAGREAAAVTCSHLGGWPQLPVPERDDGTGEAGSTSPGAG